MENRYAIILAAGKRTRMRSKLYKVLHSVAGKPVVGHILDQVEQTEPTEIVTIAGHGAEVTKSHLGERSQYALQVEQSGTGHVVMQVRELLGGKQGTTLVITGDIPLLTAEALKNLFGYHQGKNASAVILTAHAEDPTGYGRIICGHVGITERTVEQKDVSEEEACVQEINTGTFCFDNESLFEASAKTDTNNTQGEYYLTDIIEILKKEGKVVAAYQMADFDEAMGINDHVALSIANKIMHRRLNEMHIRDGVTFIDPDTTYIDEGVVTGSDAIAETGVTIKGKTVADEDCLIGAHSEIADSHIGNQVVVKQFVIEGSVVHEGADVGSYVHLRPRADVGANVYIGNFVEVKNATIDEGTKVGHLTYVGDVTLGKDINAGRGVALVNYDSKNKRQAIVGDHALIGSTMNTVAPVTIGDHAVTAVGSTITEDVPSEGLAIARARQVNKEGYAKKLPYMKG